MTSGGQISNIYLFVVYFFNASVFRQLWQLKTSVFLHRDLIHSILLAFPKISDDKIGFCSIDSSEAFTIKPFTAVIVAVL